MQQAEMSKNQIIITFPDGATREFAAPVTGMEIAESISKSLAKKSLALKVNGQPWDLSRPITENADIQILTDKDIESLEIIRHDAAHVLAEAVKELYPEVQITIGPVIEDGFYYDIHREESFTPEDLEKIEKRMGEIVDRNEAITREIWNRDDAIEFFKKQGEHFKAEIIADLPKDETITLYRQGEFIDLCRGPHLPSTGKLGKAFKLTKLAGAYWRGDSNNPMLQRIYGTAWLNDKDLKDYLHRIEEALKRDHRRLGPDLGLFHLQEEAAGAVFWHPKGWTLYRLLQDFIRHHIHQHDYVEVNTPMLLDSSFWKKSGHWDKFRENMFAIENEDQTLALKPMNCPCHVQIFKVGTKSYRDLPIRMAEFGSCHRNESSGSLHGIMRVRAMVQDDAHIFCTENQIKDEAIAFCHLLLAVYKDLGFEDVAVKFSDRPETRAGTDATWDKAEDALKQAIDATGLEYTLNPGEGAFYGPKLEFVLKDTLGRDWQCGTLQLDFVLPERLDAAYIGEDGEKHRPVMLHRAILGSLERFIGILIEHHAGKFPLWLAPVQAVITPITNEQDDYATEIYQTMKKQGLRVELDLRNEKINYKIREHSVQKVPVIMVVGNREREEGTVAIRRLGSNDQQTMSVKESVENLKKEAKMPGAR